MTRINTSSKKSVVVESIHVAKTSSSFLFQLMIWWITMFPITPTNSMTSVIIKNAIEILPLSI